MRETELACARAAESLPRDGVRGRARLAHRGRCRREPRPGITALRARGRLEPAGFAQRADVGYVASWLAGPGSPNVDGLLWFAREVLPLVRGRLPQVRIRVTGNAPPPELAPLAETVTFEGQVADLSAFYNHIRLAIVPNRFGSGVKLKTVQAIRTGVRLSRLRLARRDSVCRQRRGCVLLIRPTRSRMPSSVCWKTNRIGSEAGRRSPKKSTDGAERSDIRVLARIDSRALPCPRCRAGFRRLTAAAPAIHG